MRSALWVFGVAPAVTVAAWEGIKALEGGDEELALCRERVAQLETAHRELIFERLHPDLDMAFDSRLRDGRDEIEREIQRSMPWKPGLGDFPIEGEFDRPTRRELERERVLE